MAQLQQIERQKHLPYFAYSRAKMSLVAADVKAAGDFAMLDWPRADERSYAPFWRAPLCRCPSTA
jgi:hypothetical protein